MTTDPYRVLGLDTSATLADIKRAYRALAKTNHPDSAGEAALPRFLAIQAAYEQLLDPRRRALAARARPAGPRPADPWRADPGRARDAKADAGARARPGPGFASGQGQPSSGQARPSGSAGGAEGAAGPAAGARPGTGGGRAPGGGTGARTGGQKPPGGNRRRATRKATFGSTSYDEAHDQADTTWDGASWYGQSSGEYWRVNPREYADPRKHGPEYQARASARASARAAAGGSTSSSARGSGSAAGADSSEAGRSPGFQRAGDGPEPGSGRGPRPSTGPRSEGSRGTASRGTASRGAAFRGRPAAGFPPPSDAAPSGAADPTSRTPPAEAALDVGALFPFHFDPSRLERLPMRRVLLALVAWPPIAIAAAALIGEATGCAAFSATCTETAQLYPWIAQLGIVLALLAAPAVSRILAVGTVAVAVAAFPVAAILSASGANYDRVYGPGSLIGILAFAWLGGVVFGLFRRARRPRPAG